MTTPDFLTTLRADASTTGALSPQFVEAAQHIIAGECKGWVHASMLSAEKALQLYARLLHNPEHLLLLNALHYLSSTLNLFDPMAKMAYSRLPPHVVHPAMELVNIIWDMFNPVDGRPPLDQTALLTALEELNQAVRR